MNSKNIVIFSSGISEKNGLLDGIQSELTLRGYQCSNWRSLFANANHSDNIALLPMLIKKIPTFDYAVLICEGHDISYITRNGATEKVRTMRDNVLFEIGLCAMGLGLNRTILVTDPDVRLPDDLTGINHSIALKQIFIAPPSENGNHISAIGKEIHSYISNGDCELHQVIIGAASSGACGYASNFIFRTLEHICDGITLKNGERLVFPPEKIYVDIVIPKNCSSEISDKTLFGNVTLTEGTVLSARSRPANFRFYIENGNLHIVDCPTNISTSYDTAKIILGMDADDSADQNASDRFTLKEMNIFESTLKTLMSREYIRQVTHQHYAALTEEEKSKIENTVYGIVSNRLSVTRKA